ncbi:arylalkylamine N-acetyltransferase 1-like isoform X2 [Prorops nasuta]
MDFHIQVIKKSDKFKVLKFLRRFFFRDEPINQSIQLIPEGEDSTCQELEEYCTTDCLENNLSLMAVSTCGNIVGVSLNGKMEPHKSDEPEYITNCNNPKFKKILQLLHYVDSQVNAEGKLAGKNVLEVRIISVDSNWRGKGIAKKLMEKALEMAKEQDFDYVRTDCTSHFSAKLCERCGLRKYWEIKYIDYVDKNGKPIFTPAPPHTTVVSYTKPL